MSGGSHIVAIGSSEPLDLVTEAQGESPPPASEEAWSPEPVYEEEPFPLARSGWLAPGLAGAAALGWTAVFAYAHRSAWGATTLADGLALFAQWALPLTLIGVVWLLAMRTSRREALRFGEAARVLSDESAQLEARLTVVNRELSLAREFLAAQGRDLDTLGRVAGDRISQHADRLQMLVRDNGAQVEAIASVSATALDNMDRLRGALPVIASSAKDVANNIAAAGRTAQAQLGQMTEGFDRLNAFGAASERQVGSLQERVEAALALLEGHLAELSNSAQAQFAAIEQHSDALGARVGSAEVEALAAIRTRAAALVEELGASRAELDRHEEEHLVSLRARLSALRDEATALARALRDGETTAMAALEASRGQLEATVRDTVERLDTLDRTAVEAARLRVKTLSEEAGSFDERLAERNRQFTAEIERRMAEAAARHDAELARIGQLVAAFDAEVAERRAAHEAQGARLAELSETIVARVDGARAQIGEIGAFAVSAEQGLSANLTTLSQHLGASREALRGTDTAIATLTDDAVRLLELLQASHEQGREHLPAALAQGETKLVELEARVAAMQAGVDTSASRGEALGHSLEQVRGRAAEALQELTALQNTLTAGAERHGTTLAGLREQVGGLSHETEALAEAAQERLSAALERLGAATHEAVATLSLSSDGAIHGIAERLGAESAAAVDRVLKVKTGEAIGALEEATARAGGVTREAAVQMRDQLARIDELAGNLERRVAQARAHAEEQVDHDFTRRVALITESLNSHAIDIAKALDSEVTDVAWAAYLRGDRGVFTRRAVSLLDSGEAREIVAIYESDGEFREHVSRYIHDFEAMLRQLLSTRDGHALGVTVLSSDMGKLYVALAQAIERLRA